MTIKDELAILSQGDDLSQEQMSHVIKQVMTGECTDAQIGAFLMALRIKGETTDEIAGAVQVMRSLATPVICERDSLVDLVGTGGDGANLFNVSTAATFVAAAAGVPMAKHGSRAASSSSGSSDVLETLGMPLDLSATDVARCIDDIGVGFMFAPSHHSAMRHAIGPRRDLAIRTIFNILGPLTNPAGVQRQVLGVFDAALCEPLAQVLKRLGSEHVMVVHANDGLDEISIADSTQVAELRDGSISVYMIQPEDFNVSRADLDGLAVSNADESARLIKAALANETTPEAEKARAMIALNAGSAIYVGGEVPTLADGVALAQKMIVTGQAQAKLAQFIDFTQGIKQQETP